jgi:hypothetical protein
MKPDRAQRTDRERTASTKYALVIAGLAGLALFAGFALREPRMVWEAARV